MHTLSKSVLGFVLLGTAFGHDLYFLPERFMVSNGSQLEFALHNGDSFPESEANVTVARLRDGMLYSATGNAPIQDLRLDGNRTLGKATVPGTGDLILAIHTIPNFIEMTPDKFLPYIKEEGLTSVIDYRAKNGETAKPGRERYSKYVKSLVLAGAPNGYFNHVVGFPIEIVPEKDPYQLKKGDVLPVHVLYRGKPAADLQLEAAWSGPSGSKIQVMGRTDEDGHISVPIGTTGKWRLHSIKMERLHEPAADWESFWASLTFEIR